MKYQASPSQKVKVAYIVPTLLEGGAQQHVALLCSHIDRSRYAPIVFCIYGQGSFAESIREKGIPVVRLVGADLLSLWRRLIGRDNSSLEAYKQGNVSDTPPFPFRRIVGSVGKTITEILCCVDLALQLRARGVALVSVHWSKSKIGLIAAWLSGIPAIYTEHSTVHTYYSPLEISILKGIVPLAKRVIAVSEDTRHSVMEHLDVPSNRINVIGHAVHFDIPAQVDTSTKTDTPPTVAVLGSLAERKGHIYFLKAAHLLLQEYPNAEFLIAGDGPLRAALEDKAMKLGLDGHIGFIGAYDNDDVPEILKKVSVVAIPSIKEALGIVALEAMACGKPVVASAVGGLPEIVRDKETGLLVSPRDARALADAISSLFSSPSLCRRLGSAGREFACRQTPEKIAAQTMAVYSDVLDR
jgi:glycosyltransferase involved in cell wall biosynthesis